MLSRDIKPPIVDEAPEGRGTAGAAAIAVLGSLVYLVWQLWLAAGR
jgi:hypothetical protein